MYKKKANKTWEKNVSKTKLGMVYSSLKIKDTNLIVSIKDIIVFLFMPILISGYKIFFDSFAKK